MTRRHLSEPGDKGDTIVGAVLDSGKRLGRVVQLGKLGGVANLSLFNRLDTRIVFAVVGALLIILALSTAVTIWVQGIIVQDLLVSKGRVLAIVGAKTVGNLFEGAVANNEIREEQLFSREYTEIADTNPKKYHSPFEYFTDKALPPIQEGFLQDVDVAYAVTVDDNGYVPTHNEKYSQPLTGDYETDLANSRDGRKYDDEVSRVISHSESPYLVQNYKRDTGAESWDVSAPIYVNGKHWGAFRVGISKETVMSKAIEQGRYTVWTMLGSLLLMALVSFVIARSISRPIRSMAELAESVAAGDLSRTLEVRWGAEPGELGKALNIMVRNLRVNVEDICEASLRVGSAAEEMAATVQQQASAATQQSAAVAETTAAMEELAATAQQMSENARRVAEASNETQESTQQGEEAVTGAAWVMEQIKLSNEKMVQEIILLSQRSQEITEVMNLINLIADQTRLIAFNAAIEAAAAGETGRRFGVVASEVRRLADNVTEATKEIHGRLKEMQSASNNLVVSAEQAARKIDEGVESSRMTSEALANIVERTQSVTSLAKQISLGTQQQRTATEQVVEALREISAGAQQVAHGSKETGQVIGDLLKLSEDLKGAESHFIVKAGEERRAGETR